MIAGHAAGIAAAMATKQQVPVQRVDVDALRRKLLTQGQVLNLLPIPTVFLATIKWLWSTMI